MKTDSFRQERRQFLGTLLKSFPLVLLPLETSASLLEDRVPNFVPYSQVNNSKPVKRVVWTNKDLENVYNEHSAITSKIIRNLNSKLKQDYNPETIAFLQDELPNDFIGSLEDSWNLCQDKPTIRKLSKEYEPRTVALPSSTSFDLFGERMPLPESGIYSPSLNFLKEKYEQALVIRKENEFLETFRKYFEEVDSLAHNLGFNAVVLPESSLHKYLPYNGIKHLTLSKRELRNLKA